MSSISVDITMAKNAILNHSSDYNSDSEKHTEPTLHEAYEDEKHKRFRASGIRFYILFFGLALGFFMAALDTTIVITALGVIASEFNSVEQIGWIGSAYLFALSGFQPIYCNLCEIIGQKYSYIFSVIVFIIGSALCGISFNMNFLIVSRAIQGIGGAGLFTSVLTMICTLMDSRTRALYQSYLGAALGIASISGPLLGGYLAENNQWRWCFFINIFLGGLILLITVFLCDLPLSDKQKERKRKEKTIWQQLLQADYASFVLLMPGTILLLSGFQIGAENLNFTSVKVIVLLAVGIVLIISFVVVEMFVVHHNPIFPRSFMRSVTNVAVMVGQFMMGIAYNALIYFIPLHFQVVKGDNAIKAALELLSFIIAGVVGGFLSGIITRVTGHYKYLMWSSGVISIAGIFLIYSCKITTSVTLFYIYLAIFGFGCGILMNSLVIAGQATVSEKELTIATSHGQFTRLFGGAFGVNIGSVLFSNDLNSSLRELEKLTHRHIGLTNLEMFQRLPLPLLRKMQDLCFQAFTKIYLLIAVATVCLFISTLFVKQAKMNH